MRSIFKTSIVLLVTVSLLGLATADFCLDDQTLFLYYSWSEKRELSCSDIGDSQALSDTFCEIERVAISCHLSCSLCCEDSKGNVVKFRRQNDLWGTCRWVSKRQKRIDRYCGTEVEYITAPAYEVPLDQLVIEDGFLIQFDKLCPETCNALWCPLPTSPPTYWLTPGGPTPSPTMHLSNVPSSSKVPTSVPTASPSCAADDPEYRFEALFRPDVMLSCDFILKHSDEEKDLIRQHRYCCGDFRISMQCCKSCYNVDCPTSAPTASPKTYNVRVYTLQWVGTREDYLGGKDLRIEIYKARTTPTTTPYSTRVVRKNIGFTGIYPSGLVRNIEYKGLEEEETEDDILIEMWLFDATTKKEVEGSRKSEKVAKFSTIGRQYAYYTMPVDTDLAGHWNEGSYSIL
ncbi:predicted protein [Chaetoceros tenuissimus]|uniref:Uncharacterized protein n=1 Tax=Chaetoceros tenuissimus TaxID=426638 RepID=A0AAD3D0A5_9STRA|nr:predicted protein [Chaetoceros tenuissimus]